MFVFAYEKVQKYTRPVIISTRTFDGEVSSGCATYIILNKEGWFITAAHIMQPFLIAQENQKEIVKYRQEVKNIEDNSAFKAKKKREKINKISRNEKWITNQSYLWGVKGETASNFVISPEADLALGKLDNYGEIKDLPNIINPTDMKQGRSLCRLGFPFYQISATFDDSNNSFVLADNTFPLPFFPIEGIYTREIVVESQDGSGKHNSKFIETSSPGLKGQSGGPIFDVEGNLWGIQSQTHSYPLEFNPTILRGDKQIEENQFLNVGWGVHAETITDFLQKNKIQYDLSK